MTNQAASTSARVWDAIEVEKRRDRFVRRVTVSAWTVTFVLVIALAVMVSMQVAQMAKAALVGAVPWLAVLGVAMPLVIVLGILSVLIATLGTIGMFVRMRTASLTEIQLRLSALESMLASGGSGTGETAGSR
jgi:flagellar biosynthesis protein FliR